MQSPVLSDYHKQHPYRFSLTTLADMQSSTYPTGTALQPYLKYNLTTHRFKNAAFLSRVLISPFYLHLNQKSPFTLNIFLYQRTVFLISLEGYRDKEYLIENLDKHKSSD